MAKPEHIPGWSDIQETFTLIADQQPNQYYFTATVYTTVPNVTVVPYASVKGSAKAVYSGTGLSNQTVRVTMSR